MELLLGCGNNLTKKIKFDGVPDDWTDLVTLDFDDSCGPDIVHDLNNIELPFSDDLFDEIHAYEVLEHLGKQGDWRFFFDQFQEFYRVLKPGGYFIGTVPMWDSEWAWGDPGHTRCLPACSFIFLSQDEYTNQVGKTAMTDYRSHYSADFELLGKSEEGDTLAFILRVKK